MEACDAFSHTSQFCSSVVQCTRPRDLVLVKVFFYALSFNAGANQDCTWRYGKFPHKLVSALSVKRRGEERGGQGRAGKGVGTLQPSDTFHNGLLTFSLRYLCH